MEWVSLRTPSWPFILASSGLASPPPPSPRSRSVFYTWMPSPPPFPSLGFCVCVRLMRSKAIWCCWLLVIFDFNLVTILQSFLERTNERTYIYICIYCSWFPLNSDLLRFISNLFRGFADLRSDVVPFSLSLSSLFLYFSSTISGVTRFLRRCLVHPLTSFFPPLSLRCIS